ncbi:hypothetical protein HUJ04_013320 [Dendroctonus ponderosae]|nr:hypothetical protein HUJ04_013320 [Dendroctonus ponderosae]
MGKLISIQVEKSLGCLSVALSHNAERFSLKQTAVVMGFLCFLIVNLPSFSPLYAVPLLIVLAWLLCKALLSVREEHTRMDTEEHLLKKSKKGKSKRPKAAQSDDGSSSNELVIVDENSSSFKPSPKQLPPISKPGTSGTSANNKKRKKRDSASSDEERWLTAIESGKLEDVDDELKKIKPKDPALMTARQRAMYDRGSEANTATPTLMSLPTVSTYAGRAGPAILASKGAIWPKPQLQNVSEDYFVLLPRAFAFKASNSCSFLTSALERYWDLLQQNSARLNQKLAKFSEQTGGFLGYLGELEVNLRGACVDDEYPSLSMDESYQLWITASRAELQSETIWGVLRALETFSQLIYLGEDGLTLRLNATTIQDFPRFKHRGLLLDTSRHFLPLESILQTLDALAYNKMNVFHWHIVDDESFPYVSQSRLGAYNPHTKVYTPENIQTVIEYARLRGIRVLPEFDTPGHTSSWGLAHPELLTPCDQLKTSGPMDPSREETFEFLQSLFSELRGVFKDEFIHLGGDEVDFSCWRQSENISNLMKDLNISSYEGVESYYVQKVVDMAEGLDYKQIVWEEVFSNGVHLGNHTLVHVWKSWTDTIREVTSAGKQALLSACWYLDQLASGGDWTDFYLCDPMDFDGTPEQQERVLGGEACMWGEVVNEYNIISRTWPRASATAEKLWSAPSGTYKLDEPSSRLEEHTCRMNRRGIGAQPPNGAGFCD